MTDLYYISLYWILPSLVISLPIMWLENLEYSEELTDWSTTTWFMWFGLSVIWPFGLVVVICLTWQRYAGAAVNILLRKRKFKPYFTSDSIKSLVIIIIAVVAYCWVVVKYTPIK